MFMNSVIDLTAYLPEQPGTARPQAEIRQHCRRGGRLPSPF